jgi:hypothetical protein
MWKMLTFWRRSAQVPNDRNQPLEVAKAARRTTLSDPAKADRVGDDKKVPTTLEKREEIMQSYSFERGGSGVQLLKSGFASPEPWGVWTMDSHACLDIPARQHVNARLWIRFQVFARPKAAPCGFRLQVNGRNAGEFLPDQGAWGEVYERTFEIPAEAMDRPTAEVEFEVLRHRTSNEATPQDRRLIGIGLHDAKLTTFSSHDRRAS